MNRVRSCSIWLAILLGALLMLPTQSFAQWYGGVYGGAVFPQDADTEASAAFGITGLISSSDIEFEPGVMFGGRIGYWMEALDIPWFGLEGEFYWGIPQVEDQQITLGGVVSGGPFTVQETDFDIATVAVNLVARYPYGPIQPYVGIGGAWTFADLDNIKLKESARVSVPGEDELVTIPAGTIVFKGDDDDAFGLQLMGGLRGFVTDNVALFAEYKWVLTELELGDITFDYRAHHIYGGIEYTFGTGGVHQKP